jgi:hypothetical protein
VRLERLFIQDLSRGKACFLTLFNESPYDEDMPSALPSLTPRKPSIKAHFSINTRDKEKENQGPEPVVDKKKLPIWLNFWLYVFLSVCCLGWVIRLVIYLKSMSANIFLKKVILK